MHLCGGLFHPMNAVPEWIAPLLPLRRHLSIAHHCRGRVRLRLAASGLKAVSAATLSRLQEETAKFPAIRAIRINAAALSVVIEYDSDHIPMEWWPELLTAEDDRIHDLLARVGG